MAGAACFFLTPHFALRSFPYTITIICIYACLLMLADEVPLANCHYKWSYPAQYRRMCLPMLDKYIKGERLLFIKHAITHLRLIAVGYQVARAPAVRADPRKGTSRIVASYRPHHLTHFLIRTEYNGTWK